MNSIIVEGRLVTPTQIELATPVVISDASVEVEIRPRREQRRQDMLAYLRQLAARPARGRSGEDILRQMEEERSSWESER